MYRTFIRTIDGNNMYDISTLVANMEYYTDITGMAGKLSFFIYKDPNNIIKLNWKDGIPNVGDEVFFSNEDKLIFKGFVFTVGTDSEGVMRVTAYDQMRYFLNEDVFAIEPKTASDLFEEICTRRALINKNQYRIVTASSAVLPSTVYIQKSYADIMEDAFQQTLIEEGKKYYIIDRAGVLEFNLLGNDVSDVIIGEGSLMTGYKYEKDIDSETYNKVIFYKGDQDTGYTKSLIAQSESTIAKWGLLQSVLQATDEMTDSQIEEYARTYLEVHNKPMTSLTISAIGDDSIIAGTLFKFRLTSVGVAGRWMAVTSCTHKYSNDLHTMDLEVKILPEDKYES